MFLVLIVCVFAFVVNIFLRQAVLCTWTYLLELNIYFCQDNHFCFSTQYIIHPQHGLKVISYLQNIVSGQWFKCVGF